MKKFFWNCLWFYSYLLSDENIILYLDYVVFPRHQSLGSVKNSDKEIEDDEEDSSRNPATGNIS